MAGEKKVTVTGSILVPNNSTNPQASTGYNTVEQTSDMPIDPAQPAKGELWDWCSIHSHLIPESEWVRYKGRIYCAEGAREKAFDDEKRSAR